MYHSNLPGVPGHVRNSQIRIKDGVVKRFFFTSNPAKADSNLKGDRSLWRQILLFKCKWDDSEDDMWLGGNEYLARITPAVKRTNAASKETEQHLEVLCEMRWHVHRGGILPSSSAWAAPEAAPSPKLPLKRLPIHLQWRQVQIWWLGCQRGCWRDQ